MQRVPRAPRRVKDCRGCGRKLRAGDAIDSLASGTGFCCHCAQARAATAARGAEAREWLRGWRDRIDSMTRDVLPLYSK